MKTRGMTDKLSGVAESVLSVFVEQERKHRFAKAMTIESTIAAWNDFNTKIGSFSDDYSSL